MEVLVYLETGKTRAERDGFAWGAAESRAAWDVRESAEIFPRPYVKPLALLRVPQLSVFQMPDDAARQPMIAPAALAELSPGDDLVLSAAEWGALIGG